jgi:hypothetical protein
MLLTTEAQVNSQGYTYSTVYGKVLVGTELSFFLARYSNIIWGWQSRPI